jgi:hypothetical protein
MGKMGIGRVVTAISAGILGVAGMLQPAYADGDAFGTLGASGIARGDISSRVGETDRIAIALDAGATLQLSFHASFVADLILSDPEGIAVPLSGSSGARVRANLLVEKAGLYELAISSADGTQGLYTASVKQRWARTFVIQGTGEQIADVPMPAGAKLACVVGPARGATDVPQLLQLEDPGGNALLAGAIAPKGRVTKLPPTVASIAGVYHLTVAPADGTSGWIGRVTRTIPHVVSTSLRLTNGLEQVSFRGDGVGAIFARQCAYCHGWATSLDGVRSRGRTALGKMAGGSMPPGGGIARSELALVKAWIATGMNP